MLSMALSGTTVESLWWRLHGPHVYYLPLHRKFADSHYGPLGSWPKSAHAHTHAHTAWDHWHFKHWLGICHEEILVRCKYAVLKKSHKNGVKLLQLSRSLRRTWEGGLGSLRSHPLRRWWCSSLHPGHTWHLIQLPVMFLTILMARKTPLGLSPFT